MKRCLVFCLVFCLVLLQGCRRIPENTYSSAEQGEYVSVDTKSFHLLYNATDSFNPYAVTSKENGEICTLIYDSLITLNSNFEPIYKLAESVVTEGKTCTVILRDAKFSDGTQITANDISYCADLAKASQTRYAAQLYEVASKTVVDSKTIVFNLTKCDPFFVNLLDFPILKSGSEAIQSEDNILLPPVGSGRYVFNKNDELLTCNPYYYGEKNVIETIGLINAIGKESADHYISSGAVSFCYSDYSDSSVPRMSGNKVTVPLNNLVYLGINMNSTLLSDKYIRYAISSAVDRKAVVDGAYYGNATVAIGAFNPSFNGLEGYQTLQTESNEEIAVENLQKVGYNSKDSDGYLASANGVRLSVSLLVNSQNPTRIAAGRLIAKQLNRIGIFVNIEEVANDTYISRLQSGNFQLYLGEVKLSNNMDLSQLVIPGGSAAYGAKLPAPPSDNPDEAVTDTTDGITLTASDAVSGFYEGIYTVGDVASAFISEMPLIPICYRNGIAMLSPAVKGSPHISVSDLFYDINNFSFDN